VARALVQELDCAVVAMRYPVTDDFAIAFGDEFYEHLLGRGQPVDVAAARALAAAAAGPPSAARPAVSLATPGVFGSRAAGLEVTAPRGAPVLDPATRTMAHFPDEPERFVGRAQAMAEASAALAPDSGRTAVLLHGMAGAGKTACALELAYRHQDSFAAAAFWQAPTRDDEFAGALPSLAVALEAQLGDYGFRMTGHIGTVAALEAFLPRLRRVLDDSGILLVLDNLETLLTPQGTWRDPRWAPLIAALTGHRGESRVILTSRIPPAAPGAGVLVQPVHALSLDEAVALARELPGLRALLHAEPGPVRAETQAEADRDRVRRVLRVVQGHPKLLELAAAAAADRDRLDAAENAATGQGLEAFFRDGTSTLDPDQFLAALTAWTTTALTVLPPQARLLAEFLACLEDDDRQPGIIEANWADLWRRLDRPGDPPEPGPLLETLAAAALIQPGSSPDERSPVSYRMHPGVAAAIAAAASPEIRAAVDTELAAFWRAVAAQAEEREGGEDGGVIVHAGLAAAPYLLRRRDWRTASTLLQYAIMRNASPSVIQAALPALRHIADATRAPVDSAVLARALGTVDRAEAEMLLRDALRASAEAGDYRLASSSAGDLVNLLYDTGRLGEALDLVGQKAGYTRQAGLGPWTQLSDRAWRLQLLARMGEHRQVLTEAGELRTRMGQLPARATANEIVNPWNVREAILNAGCRSAQELGEWQQSLDLNAEILTSARQRGAGPYEVARIRFGDAWPLIRLGRLSEAGQLLRDCQQVFEDHRDTDNLARVLVNRAGLEDELGNEETAAEFVRTALRLGYARPDPREIAGGHNNLAGYLRTAGGEAAAQRAHRLAAALISQLTGMTYVLALAQAALAAELREDPSAGVGQLPSTLAEVIRAAEETEGVRLGELITALEPDTQAVEEALARILRAAADLEPDDDRIARHLRQSEPVIAAIAAACQGDRDAAAQLIPVLDDFAEDQDWAALVAVLRRILDGERGEDLLGGLGDIDTAIARETLARLASGHA
jgi:tetratricopeptide (TPR) repeat protein